MTELPNRAVDLHGFALREFLNFVRKEDPRWMTARRSGVVKTTTRGQAVSMARCGLRC